MLFNSFDFLVFFPAVVIAYFVCPHRRRWILLLFASYFFYMCWNPAYLVLTVAATVASYLCCRLMAGASPTKRRVLLVAAITANLGMLFAFKYLGFALGTLQSILTALNVVVRLPDLRFLLPIGISFYTFQALSYCIDVYRGDMQPEKHFGVFAVYVSFFPQLVAGPIERSTRLLPQFHRKHTFSYDKATSGLRLMLWGFFKKMVIADRIAVYVDAVYANPGAHFGATVAIAAYLFAYQIYCDFSAYSDIAVGAARIMGYDLMTNFRRPYHAASVRDFWGRWHISLSTWFRDYLYVPLGGNRVSRGKWVRNIAVVFLLSGLWHGAAWNFVVWDALHGLYLVGWEAAGKRLSPKTDRYGGATSSCWQRSLGIFVTFHLVTFAWIFFRAETLSDASLLIRNLFQWGHTTFAEALRVVPGRAWLAEAFCAIVLVECVHSLQALKKGSVAWVLRWPRPLRWTAYYALVMWIVFLGVFGHSPFIYFQF